MREVSIRDDVIRLGQFLKLADVVEAGAEVRTVLANGDVQVNGEVETRRGRQLRRGDEVTLAGVQLRVG
ncbi:MULTISPECIES: RNA-binding S4 domain-containing protein [Frankiaceae]|nr:MULTISPECIES: RNA-binding S4 domain-containing protein [Frankiaceae]MBE3203262.1 RNA-binding S4 domain-containing protein [Parafrankia sp. CH37]